MASRDPAFLWETEVLRTARRRPPDDTASTQRASGHDDDDWLTLREASEATGVPTSTIRKWARHENIPSFMERTSDGYLRIVSMSGIRAWTEEIGRDIDYTLRSGPGTEIDLTGEEPTGDDPRAPTVPEGSMLVPLDAWNRMLNQLGNLHEAGQQLAEARERAAKAETEARFLKERLAELRDQMEASRETMSTGTGSRPDPEPVNPAPMSLVRRAYAGWRERRRSG